MLRLAVFGLNRCVDSTADVEVAGHSHLSRPADLYEVVENPIDDRLVESSLIAIRPEIELERLKLDAKLVGNVSNANRRKIGLAGARTHAGKLWTFHVDFVVALGSRIGKGFQFWARCGRHGADLSAPQIYFQIAKLP